MKILERIPIRLEPDRVIANLRLAKEKKASINLQELIDTAESLIRVKMIYQVSYVESREHSRTVVDGITLSSRVLAANLKNTERVFPYLITIGKDLEERARVSNDLIDQYCLEAMGDMALHTARDYLEAFLKRNCGIEKLSGMSPGSLEDWPITEQKPLFSLFPEIERTGVRLTNDMLMIPRKSVSGILFPNEEGFESCQLCRRENCSSRKAVFDSSLLKRFGLASENAEGRDGCHGQ